MQASPGQNSTCIICLDLVEDKKSYHTMVCPACQRAWFHRSCIQKQAIHAGVCFRCLRCQNKDQFVMEMLTMGIRISKRLVLLFLTHKMSGASAVPGQGLPWQAWPSAVPQRTPVLCFMEELETGWGQKSRDSLDLPDAGVAGAQHFPFLLQQTTIVGQ